MTVIIIIISIIIRMKMLMTATLIIQGKPHRYLVMTAIKRASITFKRKMRLEAIKLVIIVRELKEF